MNVTRENNYEVPNSSNLLIFPQVSTWTYYEGFIIYQR